MLHAAAQWWLWDTQPIRRYTLLSVMHMRQIAALQKEQHVLLGLTKLQQATACMGHLRPRVQNKLELAGGSGSQLAELLQLPLAD